MHNSRIVGSVDGKGDRADQGRSFSIGEVLPATHRLRESLPCYERHREERRTIDLANVMDRTEMRMLDCSHCTSFTKEAFGGLDFAIAKLRNLQRHVTIKLCVVGEVNRAHRAFAKQPNDVVAAEVTANDESIGLGGRPS